MFKDEFCYKELKFGVSTRIAIEIKFLVNIHKNKICVNSMSEIKWTLCFINVTGIPTRDTFQHQAPQFSYEFYLSALIGIEDICTSLIQDSYEYLWK